MKLLFTWLLGVPALVAAMVVARAMSPLGTQVAQQPVLSSACPGQLDFNHVVTLVPKNGYRAACNRTLVK